MDLEHSVKNYKGLVINLPTYFDAGPERIPLLLLLQTRNKILFTLRLNFPVILW